MKHLRFSLAVSVVLVLMGAVRPARAQWAVVDVGAIAQLVQQVQMLDQALTTARGELSQAQQEYAAMTGGRGMQSLLSGTVRNYLPSNWNDLASALTQVDASQGALTASIQSAVRANTVLSAQQLAALSPQEQARIAHWRATIAVLQAVSGSALSNASARFADLQQLIGAIGSAADQKAVLDLQARIGAETGMLQNEQNKLQSLFQVMQAQQWSSTQQDRESIILGHGQFSARFEPVP